VAVSVLEVKHTSRGFGLIEFSDMDGNECSLQKSSLATDDAIRFGVNAPNPKIMPGDGTGWHRYALPNNVHCTTRMHLTREQVAELLPLLTIFVETGELEPRIG
jgi:hypothetical protein